MSNHHNRLTTFVLLALLAVCISANALEVTVKSPGTLHTLIRSSDKYRITTLKIDGTINSEDIMLLRDMAGCDAYESHTEGRLRSIDMGGVTLAEDNTRFIEGNNHSIINDAYTIPAYMFSNCNIEKIVLPRNIRKIDAYAFRNTALRSISLPENIIVKDYAFQGCRKLSEVLFPDFTKELWSECFSGCSSLKSITINNIGLLGSRAFKDMENLTDITIKGIIGHVDGWMCRDLPSLKSIRFEGFILNTGSSIIAENCPQLSEIVFSGTCMPMGFGSVKECPLMKKCTVTGYVIKSGDKNFIEYEEPVTFSKQMEEACRRFEEIISKDEYSNIFGVKNTLYDMVVILTDIGESLKAAQYTKLAADYSYKEAEQKKQQPKLAGNILDINLDFVKLLKTSKPYGAHDASNTKRFTYASTNDPKVKEIKDFFNLEHIAGNGDEISKMKNIMRWLHDNIRHDGSGGFPPNTDRNAIDLYKACKARNCGLNSRGLSIVLAELYLAMGWPARFITCQSMYSDDLECHIVVVVWSHTLGKWIMMDPTYDAYICDENGLLLHPGEIRKRMIEGKRLVLNDDANWNHTLKFTEKNYLYEYMAKNLFLLSAYIDSYPNVESDGNSTYYTLQPEGFNAQIGTATCDEEWFWQKP